MRVLLVGEASVKGAPPLDPVETDSGRRLMELVYDGADMPETFRSRFARRNVFVDGIKNWQPTAARKLADKIKMDVLSSNVPVILLGRRVATAFGIKFTGLQEWFHHDGLLVAVVPHPSGRNRWYNDPTNREAVKNFFQLRVP